MYTRDDVTRLAKNEKFRTALKNQDTNALREIMWAARTNSTARSPSGELLSLRVWGVLDTNGHYLAHTVLESLDGTFTNRDYYRGAISNHGTVYCSLLYRSIPDGMFNLSVSIALYETNETLLGVISAVMPAQSADRLYGLNEESSDMRIVVVGKCDTNQQPTDVRII